MTRENPFRVHQQAESANETGGEKSRRGETLREFLVLAKAGNFEQYPKLEESYQNAKEALLNLDCTEGEIDRWFDEALSISEDVERDHTLGQIGRLISYHVLEQATEKIEQEGSTDMVKLGALVRAMENLYKRALEILAVFQKQEREHLASHRAHSSKDDGEFAFGGPELSLEAIANALKSGVKMIELDVSALADGTPVISHGLSTRTSEGKKKIANISNLEEASKTEATIDRTGAPLYSLDELFSFFEKYKGLAKLTVEIKHPNVVEGVIAEIKKHGLERDVFVSAYNPQALIDVHRELPDVGLVFNSFVTELNASTILDTEPLGTAPTILPFNIAVGGTELPEGLDKTLLASHFRTIPMEMRKLLAETHGYLTINLDSARRLGINKEGLKKIADQAKKEGFELLMYRVKPTGVAFLKDEVGLLHLDEGEELVYKRTRSPRVGK